MARRTTLVAWVCAALVAGAGLFGSSTTEAAQVTKFFKLGGASELWNWTTTGITKIGTGVTDTTLPREMADPAKLSWYDADGVLQYTYCNYRPEPNGFTSLNDWKTGTAAELVHVNLAGKATGTGDLPLWGEASTMNVAAILQPTAYPGYDNVGTGWFAQTAYHPELAADAPAWWCESQDNAIGKDLTGVFTDLVEYTFDSSAISTVGTVTLWISGIVTEDLAGMESGTAEYGILEGAANPKVYTDLDGDGYFPEDTATYLHDCCDDPAGPCDNPTYQTGRGSADPSICATCTCGYASCAPCARCIHPGVPSAWEFPNDRIDSNCNNLDDGCVISRASFGTEIFEKISTLHTFRDKYLLGRKMGRVFVEAYEEYSPPFAHYVGQREWLRAFVRTLLLPLIGFISLFV